MFPLTELCFSLFFLEAYFPARHMYTETEMKTCYKCDNAEMTTSSTYGFNVMYLVFGK